MIQCFSIAMGVGLNTKESGENIRGAGPYKSHPITKVLDCGVDTMSPKTISLARIINIRWGRDDNRPTIIGYHAHRRACVSLIITAHAMAEESQRTRTFYPLLKELHEVVCHPGVISRGFLRL